jgi:hypothetical protein
LPSLVTQSSVERSSRVPEFGPPLRADHVHALHTIALLILRRVFPHPRGNRASLSDFIRFVSF